MSLSRRKSFVIKKYEEIEERGYDLFLRFSARDDYSKYKDFRRNDFPVVFFFVFMVIISIFWGLGNSPIFHFFQHGDLVSGLGLVGLLITLFGNVVCGWCLFMWHFCNKFKKSHFIYSLFSPYISAMENIFLMCAPIGPGFNLLAASLNSDCGTFETYFVGASRLCNPEASVDALPQYITLLVFLAPEFSQAMVKCSNFPSVFSSWLFSLFFVSLAMFSSKSYTSALFPFFCICYGFFVYEVERRDMEFFFKLKLLYQTEDSLRKKEEEATQHKFQSKTLNNIISNVSHDLISPLQALEMGFESVLRLLVSSKRYVSSVGSGVRLEAGAKEEQMSLDSCLELAQSMRGTLLFMSAIINRCLDTCAASGGITLKPHVEDIDIQDSINRTCLCISDMQNRVPVVVSPWPSEVDRIVSTDKRWFEGNLLCIISNAIKFSQDDSILPVEVRSRVEKIGDESSGVPISWLTIEVTDSGKELSDEDRKKFFLQPDQVGRADRGGVGTGLFALAKRVESLGGVFGSRPRSDGKSSGTVVWFTIPIHAGNLLKKKASVMFTDPNKVKAAIAASATDSKRVIVLPPTPPPQPPAATISVSTEILTPAKDLEPPPSAKYAPVPANSHIHAKSTIERSLSSQSKQKFANLHILVVDDAITIMRITKMCLEKEGHIVSQAHNGLVALEKMKTTVFDAVLMDIQMPIMGGIESTKKIREFEESCGPRRAQVIIGMSANGDADTRTETIECGMDAFIPKPFSLFRFLKVLEGVPFFTRVSADREDVMIAKSHSLDTGPCKTVETGQHLTTVKIEKGSSLGSHSSSASAQPADQSSPLSDSSAGIASGQRRTHKSKPKSFKHHGSRERPDLSPANTPSPGGSRAAGGFLADGGVIGAGGGGGGGGGRSLSGSLGSSSASKPTSPMGEEREEQDSWAAYPDPATPKHAPKHPGKSLQRGASFRDHRPPPLNDLEFGISIDSQM